MMTIILIAVGLLLVFVIIGIVCRWKLWNAKNNPVSSVTVVHYRSAPVLSLLYGVPAYRFSTTSQKFLFQVKYRYVLLTRQKVKTGHVFYAHTVSSKTYADVALFHEK